MPLSRSRPILIVAHLVTYPTIYLSAKYVLLPCLRLFAGYKKSVVGTCVILAPPNQMQLILQGIEYLRTLDLEMYQRLTARRRYTFFYKKDSYDRMLDIFSLPDSFLLWGKDGVVICFVQSVIGSTLEQSPFKKPKTTDRQARQQLFEWLSQHSFPPEIVKHYKEFAEKKGEKVGLQ